MTDKAEWLALAERCEKATGPDRSIDCWIENYCGIARFDAAYRGDPGMRVNIRPLTASIDAITALIEWELPGWMWRVQTCGVSSEAWVAPDLNNPLCSPEIRADEARWHDYAERNEVELRPGSNKSAIIALCAAFCRAMAEKAGEP